MLAEELRWSDNECDAVQLANKRVNYMNMPSYSCCEPTESASKRVATLASFLKLVSEESRLRLLCILQKGEHCVCELVDHVSLSQSLISHHLKILKEAGVVRDKKRGLRVYYSLTEKGSRVTTVLFSVTAEEEKT